MLFRMQNPFHHGHPPRMRRSAPPTLHHGHPPCTRLPGGRLVNDEADLVVAPHLPGGRLAGNDANLVVELQEERASTICIRREECNAAQRS
jgi:hypothetical protein